MGATLLPITHRAFHCPVTPNSGTHPLGHIKWVNTSSLPSWTTSTTKCTKQGTGHQHGGSPAHGATQ